MDEDEAWARGLDCAHRQLETYAYQNALKTPEQGRIALSDALQHAVGMLKLNCPRK